MPVRDLLFRGTDGRRRIDARTEAEMSDEGPDFMVVDTPQLEAPPRQQRAKL